MTRDVDGTVVDGGVVRFGDAYHAVRAVFSVFSKTKDARPCTVFGKGVAARLVWYAGGVLLKVRGYSRRGARVAGIDSAHSGGIVTPVETAAVSIGCRRNGVLYAAGTVGVLILLKKLQGERSFSCILVQNRV